MRVLEVGAEDRGDDLDLVAEVARERRSQRAVGEATGQDRGLAGTALTTEERAGDLPGRVHPLLDVDGEGEEVDPLTRRGGGDGRQQGRAADLDQDCAGGELGEPTGLEGQGEAGVVDGAGHTDGVGRLG